jgi:O-antigen ligase
VSKLHFKNKIKEILTSGYWLIASLTGAFFSFFALNRGGVVVFIEAGFFFVLLNLVTGQYKLKQIPTIHWVTLAICLYLIIFGNLFASHEVKTKYVMYPVRMLFIVFTVHCLSLKKIDSRVYEMLPIVWCLSIFWQFVAVKFFNMPFGTYGNPHYLSNFIISILPLIVYSFWVTNGWYKWLFIGSGLLAFDMLLRTGSRTAFLAISFSVVFSLIFFIKSRTKWIGLLLVALSFAIIYFSNYGGVADRVKDLLVNLATEERVYFWKSALQMLKNNNLIDWIFGNGIGSYRADYPDYATPKFRPFWFAHLHPLEILYENGFTGVVLVYGGLVVLFGLTIKTLINTISENISILIKCMLVIFLCWMIHSNLTFPFYSKYAQYPFGFILGTMLVLIDQSNLATKNRTAPAKD